LFISGVYDMTKFVAISDTHTKHEQLDVPEGDVLLHAGDITERGSVGDVIKFGAWLQDQPHDYKVIIAGNHDFCFEDPKRRTQAITMLTNQNPTIFYLEHDHVRINGINIYGAPHTPFFHDWAFNVKRGEPLAREWEKIPNDTDVLLTHGPPHGVLDRVERGDKNVGCKELKNAIKRVKPDYHVFGHIHEAFGEFKDDSGTHYINASQCTLDYNADNEPIVFEYNKTTDDN
jgi:Icc-related predicted phosphoesterase